MELNEQRIIDFITDINNFEEVHALIDNINSFNGSLMHLDYNYNDEEFFDVYFGINTIDAVRAVCYGDYKFEDEFVKFNAYGNLESANKYEVMAAYNEYKEDILEEIFVVNDICERYLDLPEEFYLN